MSKILKKSAVTIAMLSGMLTVMQPTVKMINVIPLPMASLAIEVEASDVYFDRCDSGYQSIVDALESIGVDSSYGYRKKIAKANGISDYSGKASQNTKMLKLLKKGELIKPDAKRSSNNESSSYVSEGGEAVYNEASSHLDKKYGKFDGLGFHWRAWCADFVSWCASNAGQSDAIPWNASVSGLRSAIKDAGGKEYSKSEIKDGAYVPVKGDIIIFKSNGASHVGIVDYASDGRIYYIDGNNTTYGNGNKSSVHYSDCSVSKKTFTCVLKPNYR